MATEVASAYVSIGASTKGLGRSINKEFAGVESSAGRTGTSVAGKFIAPIAAGIAALGVGKFFTNAVNEASDLNEAGTALEAIFGDAVGTINEFAAGGAAALGQTELQVKNAAQTFGVYANAAGLASDESAAFSTDLVGLSTDLASFYNADPSEVVEALGSALRGEAEPMRRFGVLLDDATLKAQAMAMGIYDGNGPLDQQTKILAANAAIMDQTTVAQGDFAKTSGGLANQQRILAATWTNFTGQLGTAFLPAVTSVITKLNELAGPALSAVSSGVQGAVDWFTSLTSGFGDVTSVSGFMSTLFDTIQTLIGNVISAAPGLLAEFLPKMVDGMMARYSLIIDAVLGIVETLVSLAPELISTVVAMLPTLVDSLIGMIPALLAGAVQLFTSLVNAIPLIVPPLLTQIVGMLPGLITTLLGMIPTLLETALSLFESLVTAVVDTLPVLLTTILDMLPEIIGAVLDMLPKLIESALELFLGLVTGLLDALPTLLVSILDMLPDILGQILAMLPALIDAAVQLFTGLVEALPVILPKLLEALMELGPELVSTIIDMVPLLWDAGAALIQGLIDGAGSLLSTIGEFFLDMLPSWIVEPFKAAMGINSPSKLFAEFGGNIGQGLVDGMDGMRADAEKSMLGLVSTASTVPRVDVSASDAGNVTAQMSDAQIARIVDGVIAASTNLDHTAFASMSRSQAGSSNIQGRLA